MSGSRHTPRLFEREFAATTIRRQRIVGVEACIVGVVGTDVQHLQQLHIATDGSRGLCRAAYVYAVLIERELQVVGGTHPTCHRTRGDVGKRLRCRVVEVSRGVVVPTPVAEREHTLERHVRRGACYHVELHTHVFGVYAGHTHGVQLRVVVHVARLGGRLVHPLREVGVESHVEPLVAQTVTQLEGECLLVDCVLVYLVARLRHEEHTATEERCTTDVSDIGEDIVVAVDVVVQSALDAARSKVLRVRLGVSLIIVESVVTPVARRCQRTRYECRDAVFGILQLREHTVLHDVAIVVAEHHIANAQFLVLPVGVERSGIVGRVHAATVAQVGVVGTVVEVGNLRRMRALVRTHVEAGVEVETLCELTGVRREQSVPDMVVEVLRHHHLRAGIALLVQFLHLVIGEGAVGVAEVVAQLAVGSSVPAVGVCGVDTLTRVAIAVSDGHVESRVQRRLIVDKPDMIK